MKVTRAMQDQFINQLETYLSEQTGKTVKIVDGKPLAGGASRDTWKIRADVGGTVYDWVLRRDLPTQMFEDALTREQEYRMMDAAYQSGVMVAQVRYLCTDASVLGGEFFIMDYVEGISIGRKVITMPELATARDRLPDQLAEQLANIHNIDLDAYKLDFLAQPRADHSPQAEVIAQCYDILDTLGIKSSTWEWVLRWADNNKPADTQRTFVHGDFRIGNVLVNGDGLTAVIDWEFAHVGDPDEELGYVCMRDWRFGNGTQHFAGLSDRETFITAYERYSGRQVNRANVDWWEIMGNIRWGIICMSQANRHLSGEEPSVELASLGRRSAEMQLETLRLIQKQR